MASRREIEASEMTCYRRILRVPWTECRINQSILKQLKIRQSLKFFGRALRRNGNQWKNESSKHFILSLHRYFVPLEVFINPISIFTLSRMKLEE